MFTSVADLADAITGWADHWNHDPKPFIWKATAEQIIERVSRGRASLHRAISAADHDEQAVERGAAAAWAGHREDDPLLVQRRESTGAWNRAATATACAPASTVRGTTTPMATWPESGGIRRVDRSAALVEPDLPVYLGFQATCNASTST